MKKDFTIKNYGLKCEKCGKTFLPKTKGHYGNMLKCSRRFGTKIYCSDECKLSDNEHHCLNCGKLIHFKKFCNNSCAASFNNKNRIVTDEHKTKTSKTIKNRAYAIRELLNLPKSKSSLKNEKKNLLDYELIERIKNELTEEELLVYSKSVYGVDRLATSEDVLSTCPICGKKFYASITKTTTCSQKCANVVISRKRIQKMIKDGSTGLSTFIGNYTYKNLTVRCESKLEVAALKVLIDEHNMTNVERPDFFIPYIDKNGIERNYYPDFISSDGDKKYLIEVKDESKKNKKKGYFNNIDIKKEVFYDYCKNNNLIPIWMNRYDFPNLSKVYRQTLKEMKSL